MSDMQTLQAKLSDTRASIESMRKFLSGKTKLEALFTIDCLRWREQDLIWKINRCMAPEARQMPSVQEQE